MFTKDEKKDQVDNSHKSLFLGKVKKDEPKKPSIQDERNIKIEKKKVVPVKKGKPSVQRVKNGLLVTKVTVVNG